MELEIQFMEMSKHISRDTMDRRLSNSRKDGRPGLSSAHEAIQSQQRGVLSAELVLVAGRLHLRQCAGGHS
jgi:hypothetical protein